MKLGRRTNTEFLSSLSFTARRRETVSFFLYSGLGGPGGLSFGLGFVSL